MGRWNLQGMTSGEGLYPEGRLRLRRNLLASGYDKVYQDSLIHCSSLDYEIWKMDVKTAFLNGSLEETIHMVQPEGFTAKGQEKKVCKLQKFIYELKQASRSWNLRFDQWSNHLDFYKVQMNLVCTSGAPVT